MDSPELACCDSSHLLAS